MLTTNQQIEAIYKDCFGLLLFDAGCFVHLGFVRA